MPEFVKGLELSRLFFEEAVRPALAAEFPGLRYAAALLGSWFLRAHEQADWRAIKYLALFNALLLYASFLFSLKPPQSNHLYVTLPVPVLYAFYCWDRLLARPRWRKLAAAVLACGILFHAGLALHNLPRVSLYAERGVPASAIEEKSPALLGRRRPGSLY